MMIYIMIYNLIVEIKNEKKQAYTVSRMIIGEKSFLKHEIMQ